MRIINDVILPFQTDNVKSFREDFLKKKYNGMDFETAIKLAAENESKALDIDIGVISREPYLVECIDLTDYAAMISTNSETANHGVMQKAVIQKARYLLHKFNWYKGICINLLPDEDEINSNNFNEIVKQIVKETIRLDQKIDEDKYTVDFRDGKCFIEYQI